MILNVMNNLPNSHAIKQAGEEIGR